MSKTEDTPTYQAPQLKVFGSVAELTAGGSKPGNEAGIQPGGSQNNPGNGKGNNSNRH